MGWANCGTDSRGRLIGYAHEATCDHPECDKQIDRGLSYACGDMHGEADFYCEKYFCEAHRSNLVEPAWYARHPVSICDACAQELLATGEWCEDEEEGLIRQSEAEASR